MKDGREEKPVSGQADRERAVDDVLRRTRAGQSRPTGRAPSDACLDPETLALWVDDGLSAAERATAERHLADCARCQATLAALVRTAPVPEVRQPWWRLSRVAWLAPLTAAAAALVIWIVVPAAPPPAQSTTASAPPASSPQAAKVAAKPEAESAPAPANTAKPQAAERRDEKQLAEKPLAAPEQRQRAQAPASEVAAAPPPATPAPAAAPPPPLRSLSGAAADSFATSAAQANAAAPEIVSPESMSRWRITGGRSIERSTDGGATWQQQFSDATFTLAAGSAPSPSICWVRSSMPRGFGAEALTRVKSTRLGSSSGRALCTGGAIMTKAISAAFPYPKKRKRLFGRQMAYVEVGQGDPIVLLHGNPTSSYLWRNVIPHLEALGRCIAPDLIGMGDSDKLPDSGPGSYRFVEHRRYLDALLESLNVHERVTFVIHDWGSALGFDWANRHRKAVKGIAYMEAIVLPQRWDHWDKFNMRTALQGLRSAAGETMVLRDNFFVEQILPKAILRTLSAEEMAQYRRPFAEPGEGRRPTLTWPREIPVEGEPADVVAIVTAYDEWLATSRVPKLFLKAEPGGILSNNADLEFVHKLPAQTEVTVAGVHYVQEDSPHEIGQAIAGWMGTLG